MISKKGIKEISRNTNMSEKDVTKLLDEVCKPSLDNTHCDFDLGIGASDQSIKRD